MITATAATNEAIKAAQNLPDLVTKLRSVDPAAAEQLEGKALLASKTPWGTIAGGIVGWVAGKYGFGWDAQTCTLVAGVCVLGASYAMRWITASPISRLR